jgi:hypothetical protein
MSSTKNRKVNERFYDYYKYFDEIVGELFGAEEDGVKRYLDKMKESYTEARDIIPEWDITYERLEHIRQRFMRLRDGDVAFEHFQGKDEDVVWMQVFQEKMDAKADPLAKYAKIDFSSKQGGHSFWDKVKAIFN